MLNSKREIQSIIGRKDKISEDAKKYNLPLHNFDYGLDIPLSNDEILPISTPKFRKANARKINDINNG